MLTTSLPFITNVARSSSVMSVSGSPAFLNLKASAHKMPLQRGDEAARDRARLDGFRACSYTRSWPFQRGGDISCG
jgi:hypothetical protein